MSLPLKMTIAVLLLCLGVSIALTAGNGWQFELDRQDQPSLSYRDSNGNTVFYLGCGGHFVMDAVYPGAVKKDDAKVSITIANADTRMNFAGVIFSAGLTDGPAHATVFSQADLGYARDDPNLYEQSWHDLENKFFDLLDSGKQLTISAEGKSYVLPAVNAPQWRQRFQKIC
jgi:hypothetical protein